VLAVGDADFQKRAIGKMKSMSTGEGRTVLFVSHNMGSVQNLCTNSILLQAGKIIYSGETSDAISCYQAKKNNNSKIVRTIEDVPVYISSVLTCDANAVEKNNFAFSEDIHLRIGVVIKKFDPILKISLALLSKDGTRIFSDYKYILSENEASPDFKPSVYRERHYKPNSMIFSLYSEVSNKFIFYDSIGMYGTDERFFPNIDFNVRASLDGLKIRLQFSHKEENMNISYSFIEEYIMDIIRHIDNKDIEFDSYIFNFSDVFNFEEHYEGSDLGTTSWVTYDRKTISIEVTHEQVLSDNFSEYIKNNIINEDNVSIR